MVKKIFLYCMGVASCSQEEGEFVCISSDEESNPFFDLFSNLSILYSDDHLYSQKKTNTYIFKNRKTVTRTFAFKHGLSIFLGSLIDDKVGRYTKLGCTSRNSRRTSTTNC